MTKSEHERERRAFWDACCAASYADGDGLSTEKTASYAACIATAKLAERDKMFPGPEAINVSDRLCSNCKHENVPESDEPCNGCLSRGKHFREFKTAWEQP